jgi:hypothetical protein
MSTPLPHGVLSVQAVRSSGGRRVRVGVRHLKVPNRSQIPTQSDLRFAAWLLPAAGERANYGTLFSTTADESNFFPCKYVIFSMSAPAGGSYVNPLSFYVRH